MLNSKRISGKAFVADQTGINKLKNDFDRNKELFKKNLISADEFDRVKFEYESTKATFNLAKLELN